MVHQVTKPPLKKKNKKKNKVAKRSKIVKSKV